MHRSGLVFACLFACAAGAPAASPNPEDLAVPPEIQVKARALVRQLGSEDFDERENAQKQLTALGRLARPALLQGATTSPEPEVRLRCEQLMPNATALDTKARLDTFLADTAGKYEHDLPAWNTFRALVCNEYAFFGRTVWSNRPLDKSARKAFVEMFNSPANRKLLIACDGSRVDLIDLVMSRRQELHNMRYPPGGDESSRNPSLEDVTALLFADSLVGSQYVPRRRPIGTLLTASGFSAAVRGSEEKSKVYRAVAVAWLNSRSEPREMYSAINIATSLDLPDQACALAARLVTAPGVTSSFRGRAASNLVSIGTKKHIPLLEKALNDPFVVYSNRVAFLPGNPDDVFYELQLRDLALAVSILLTDQKLEDYGFSDRYAGSTGADTRSFSYTRYYFATEDARKTAFAKWAAWRKVNATE